MTRVPPRRRSRPSARAAAAPPRRRSRDLGVALPSGRSVALGLALLVGAVSAYGAARETSLFAVSAIELTGAPPRVESEVRRALRDERGTSLLKIDPARLANALAATVPEVESASVDRSFPHTLAIRIRPERPVAVLRRGADSWVVSARGRVLRTVPLGALRRLPRIWLSRAADPRIGEQVDEQAGARAVAALAPLGDFVHRVLYVRAGQDETTLVLRTGVELRLGDTGDLRLKLAIARRVLRMLGQAGPGTYLDVSVPERPVTFNNSQVEG